MILNSTVLSHLAAGKPVDVRWLIYARPLDRDTGLRVGIGFWTGIDDVTRTIAGETRTYAGAQGAIEIPQLLTEKGVNVQTFELGLSVSPEAENLVRGFEPRFAPIEVLCEISNPETGDLFDRPVYFDGVVDSIDLPTPALGGERMMTVRCASSARQGAMTQAGYKSDQSQRQRSGDLFRRYSATAGIASDTWGST